MFYTDIFMFSTDISSDPSDVNKHYQCPAVYADCLAVSGLAVAGRRCQLFQLSIARNLSVNRMGWIVAPAPGTQI